MTSATGFFGSAESRAMLGAAKPILPSCGQ